MTEPNDAQTRRQIAPVICYPTDTLPQPDMALYSKARTALTPVDKATAAPREAAAIRVPAGHFLRIHSVEGPQVGDLRR